MPWRSVRGRCCDSEVDDLAGLGLRIDIEAGTVLAGKNVALQIFHCNCVVASIQVTKQDPGGSVVFGYGDGSAIRRREREGSAGDEVFCVVESAVCVGIKKEIDEQSIGRDFVAYHGYRLGWDECRFRFLG